MARLIADLAVTDAVLLPARAADREPPVFLRCFYKNASSVGRDEPSVA
jgi:hypothetical protein